MRLQEVVEYLNEYLRIADFPDYPNALNGLQVENRGEVRKLAVAVDASAAAIQETVRRGCDFLLVHHGLFWDGNRPVTDRRYRRLAALLERDVAVYSAHLPLDAHPEVGNNALLARAVGATVVGEFGSYQGTPIGTLAELEITRETLCARLDDLLGQRVRLIAGGPERIHRLAVVTGGGGDLVREAAAANLDAFITGEGAHHTYFDAVEGGINVYYGGHYATETFGVKALGEHLGRRFGLEWEFLELPTGM